MADNDLVQTQLVAAGGIDWAAGVPTLRAGAKGFSGITDGGVGVVVLDVPNNAAVNPGDEIIEVTANAAIFAQVVYDRAASSATSKTFRVFNALGAALDDIPLQIRISRLQTL